MIAMTDALDRWKQDAADSAAAQVSNGMIVGLGSGSTAAFAVRALVTDRLLRAADELDALLRESRSAPAAAAAGPKGRR